jgi:hypothetical protein
VTFWDAFPGCSGSLDPRVNPEITSGSVTYLLRERKRLHKFWAAACGYLARLV